MKAFVVLLTLLVSFVSWRFSRELMWFVSASRSITTANGEVEESSLHYCCQSRVLILTRRAGARRESYAIVPPFGKRKGDVWRCKGWAAPRLPLFPYLVTWSDVPFDCDSDTAALTHYRGPLDREIRFGDHAVAFLADDGSRLAVGWE
jgi:hypothetical protein